MYTEYLRALKKVPYTALGGQGGGQGWLPVGGAISEVQSSGGKDGKS